MRANNKLIMKSIVVAISLSVATAASAQVKIGHMATMSGPLGGIGVDQYDGFMLRVQQNGGKLGGQVVQVIRSDDQGKAEVGVQGAKELIEKEKVNLFVGVTAGNVLSAVYPYLTKAEVPFVDTNGATSNVSGDKCSPWFVTTGFQSDSPHEAAGREAQVRGYKKIIVITPNYQTGKDAVAGFKRFYKGQLEDEIYPAMGQSDFSAELTQIAAAGPDVVYAFLPGGMGINFVKQYSQAGLMKKVPLLSSFTIDDLNVGAVRDAAVGSIVSAHWTSDSKHPKSQQFVKDFEAKYKRRATVYAMQGYDGAMLIEQTLQASPKAATDKNEFMRVAKSLNFGSVRGDLKFNRNGIPIQDYNIWKVVKQQSGDVGFELQNVALRAHQDAYAVNCRLK